jgi:excisionase family DNA binding protein
MHTSAERRLLTVRKTAKSLAVSEDTVRRRIIEGALPAVRLGGRGSAVRIDEGELGALEWGDIDEVGRRFRIKAGKTASARRFVAVPDWLMEEIAATCPREDRSPGRRVFIGFSPDVAKNVMARACKTAGIVHRHPRPEAPLRERADRPGGSGDAGSCATRALEEVPHSRHVLARPDRRLGTGCER